MSVINNMLKDLETRSSQFTPIEIASVQSAVAHKPKRTNALAITLIMVLLVVGLALLFFQLQYNRVELVKTVEKIVEAPVPVVPVKSVAEPIVAPVNQIIGLQMRESTDNLSLEFSLREKVISYLKERSENRFVYYLKDIRSEIVAPLIKDNRWIKQLSISPRDEGVDITFRTASSVLVETRQQLQNGEQIWAIKLKKSAQPIVQPALSPRKEIVEQLVKKLAQAKAPSPQVGAKPESPAEPIIEAKVVKLDIKSSQPQLSAGEQLQRAVILLNYRRWAEAEKLFQGLMNGPQDLAARTHLLGIFAIKEQTDRLAALLRESIERYPQQALFKTEYARSLFKLNAYQSVIEFLQNITNADATQFALLAASYQRLDQHRQAISYYKKSLDKDGRQAKNWIGLGISQEQSAELKDALNSYRTATKLGNINTRLQAFVEKRSMQLEKALN